jgi:hypothetical protein
MLIMGGSRWPCKSLKAKTLMRNVGSAERGVEWVQEIKANRTTNPDVRLARSKRLLDIMKRVLREGVAH